MWVFEEKFKLQGKEWKLSDYINTNHVNVRYLPDIALPENLIADSDVKHTCQDADTFVFVLPHQFVRHTCDEMKGLVRKGSRGITLIKGLDEGQHGIGLVSDVISNSFNGMDVSVLMGANIANEIARGNFCETTIGYSNLENGQIFQKLFHTPQFRVAIVNDPVAVELCGALKNIVAIGAGFVDGLGLGSNTKAAIIRIGLSEMMRFAKMFDRRVKDSTFLESCGVGDLMTTCYGGRNRKAAEDRVKTGKSFQELEKALDGQKLQGTLTAAEVYNYLQHQKTSHGDLTEKFPFFTTVYKIVYEDAPFEDITRKI